MCRTLFLTIKNLGFVLIFCFSLISSRAMGVYAQSIYQFSPGSPNWPDAPIENILGAPDTAEGWRDCQGGIGHLGWVIVDMGAGGIYDVSGEDIFLWFGGFNSSFEVVEALKVEASIDGSQFYLVGSLPAGSTIEAPVPLFSQSMDLGNSGLSHARYLKIYDMGSDETYCGLELNAVEGVPEPATVLLLSAGLLALRKRRKVRTE
jgi:hypothetical protein